LAAGDEAVGKVIADLIDETVGARQPTLILTRPLRRADEAIEIRKVARNS